MRSLTLLVLVFISLFFTTESIAKTYIQLNSYPQCIENNYAVDYSDTVVFIKPTSFGTTIWYINSIPQGIVDSFVFIPDLNERKNVVIVATYNGIAVISSIHMINNVPVSSDSQSTSKSNRVVKEDKKNNTNHNMENLKKELSEREAKKIEESPKLTSIAIMLIFIATIIALAGISIVGKIIFFIASLLCSISSSFKKTSTEKKRD